MMTVVVVFEEDVLRLICGYAPQIGRSLEEKHSEKVSRFCILHMIYLCAWVTLMDTLVGILMGFMEGMVYVRGTWKEECH